MNPLDPLEKHHVGQHVYLWLTLLLYGGYVVLESIGKYTFMRTNTCSPGKFISIHFCSEPDQGLPPHANVNPCKEREDV